MKNFIKIKDKWYESVDDAQVYAFNFLQNLQLGLGESLAYADRGIPAGEIVQGQMLLDPWIGIVRDQFQSVFAAIDIEMLSASTARITVTRNTGENIAVTIPHALPTS